MLTAYKLHAFRHQTLHRFMMRFFKTLMEMIRADKPFSDEVFHPVFLPIAKRHKKLIYQNCRDIFEEFQKLMQQDEAATLKIWARMEQGLNVQDICKGQSKPVHRNELPEPLATTVKEMFEKLYESVLRGKDDTAYVERYGSIRKHFEEFHCRNMEVTLCPFCGISPVRTDEMMEYDHYLPKSLYPFHAVNLENLVPACKDCNQTEKGATDVLKATDAGKLFYPYAADFKGIEVEYRIDPRPDLRQSEWDVSLTSRDGCKDEVESWKMIYGIEKRYENFALIRMDKWFKVFYTYAQKRKAKGEAMDNIVQSFFDLLDAEEEHKENFLRRPAYTAMFRDTKLLKAFEESQKTG